MGRQMIEIKRIENREKRHVAFCKRRVGLFKKLSELCILCDAQAAALVRSPGGRLHVFSHPRAPSVFRRFLHGPPPFHPERETVFYPERESAAADLSAECEEMEAMREAERAMKRWWEEISFEGMDPVRLRRLRRSLAELRQTVQEKMMQQHEEREEPEMHAAWTPPLLPSSMQDSPFFSTAATARGWRGTSIPDSAALDGGVSSSHKDQKTMQMLVEREEAAWTPPLFPVVQDFPFSTPLSMEPYLH